MLGLPVLVPILNALASYPFMVLALKRGDLPLAVVRMLVWALTMGACATALSYWRPWDSGALFLRAAAYRTEMFTWIMTGVGAESTPSQFIPQQLGQAVLFAGLAIATGGALAMPMGAVLMNYMGLYVGSLAAASARPGLTALLAWHPWAVIRIIAFVVLGVALSAPLLSRIGRFRVDWGVFRTLVVWATAGLVADVVLKTLFAPAWQRLLLAAVGW
jgi:hypothetical protein